MTTSAPLARRIGTGDAVYIGLGSMIGAGVFASFAPAAAAAGAGLLIGLVIAAIVAYCNASSSAQLAAQYPTSGGTYVYGTKQLGPWPGFIAGWGFIVGKTASCAAMALTFATYAAPAGWEKPAAVAAVLVLASVNYVGVTRTVAVTRIVVTVVLVVLGAVVVIGFSVGRPDPSNILGQLSMTTPFGVLQSAGLLFFAFAGYARIATMGEEVVEPRRTIPHAITIALAITFVVYAVTAVTALLVLGPQRLAHSGAPLAEVASAGLGQAGVVLVAIGASAASLGALLGLLAGIGRTGLAMARGRDLPLWLAAVHPRFQVPHRVEFVLAAIVIALVLTVDLREAIGFSSFGVLVYYLIANLSALTQRRPNRRYRRWVQITGILGCVVLLSTLPIAAIIGGLVILTAGIAYRVIRFAVLSPSATE